MTSHSFDPSKIEKMRSHSLQPSSWQFVGPLRSSSFGRDARWNLLTRLEISYTLIKKKIKRKKRLNRESLSAHGRPAILVRACAESRAQRSFREHSRPRPRIRKIDERSQKRIIDSSRPPSRFFKFDFLKQVATRKTRLPEQRMWQPARPYLLTITTFVPEVYYLSCLTLYLKKWGKAGIPTHSFHESHA